MIDDAGGCGRECPSMDGALCEGLLCMGFSKMALREDVIEER